MKNRLPASLVRVFKRLETLERKSFRDLSFFKSEIFHTKLFRFPCENKISNFRAACIKIVALQKFF